MIKIENDNQKVCCDRCSEELKEEVYVMNAGDCLCKKCFDKEYRILTAEEYKKEFD